MTTTTEVYKGSQLTAIRQPNGLWMVEVVPVGGGGKSLMTGTFPDMKAAIAAARRIVDSGITR
jgi:hypothetical protein